MGSHQQSGRILCEAVGWLRLAQCRSVSRRLVDLYPALEFNTGCDGVIGCKCNVSVWTGLRAGAYLVSCIRLRKDAECGTKYETVFSAFLLSTQYEHPDSAV